MNEIDHKIGIAVKKDCQVTISPLLQRMLGFKRAIFQQGDHVADWVADVTRGVNSLYAYCPLVEPRMVIWDSTPVPEKCIKTKEIPFREKIMPKETPCLDLISHPTCLKLEPFSL